MQFNKLKLEGFAKFVNKEITFKPGINLFIGANESGKSTIQKSIMSVLYGIGKKEDQQKVLSWFSPEICRVSLEYQVEDSRKFTIIRDFHPADIKLSTAEGTEIKKTKVKETIAHHLGITDSRNFESTAFIRQTEVSQIASLKNPTEILENLPGINSIRTALQSITKQLDKIDNPRTPKLRDLQKKEEELREKEEQLTNVEERLKTYHNDKENYTQSEKNLQNKNHQLIELQARQKGYQELEEMHSKKEKLEEKIKQIHKTIALINSKKDTLENTNLELQNLKGYEALPPLLTSIIAEIKNNLRELKNKLNTKEEKEIKPPCWNIKYIFAGIVLAILSTLGGIFISKLLYTGNILTAILLVYALFQYLLQKKDFENKKHNIEIMQNEIDNLHSHLQKNLQPLKMLLQALVTIEIASELKETDIDPVFTGLNQLENNWQKYQSLTSKLDNLKSDINIYLETSSIDIKREDIAKLKKDFSLDKLEEIIQSCSAKALNLTTERELINRQIETFSDLDLKEKKKNEGTLNPLKNEIEKLKDHLGRLNSNIKAFEISNQDAGSLYEEIKILKEEIEDLKFKSDVFQKALSKLEETYHESLKMPGLEENIGQALSQITNGRYSKIQVKQGKDKLDISVYSSEKEGYIDPAAFLSIGAKEQLYFSLRLSLADQFSGGKNPPLIIDDAFINFDDDRLINSLKILTTLSQTKQIIIFTHDQRYERFMKELMDKKKDIVHYL